MRSVTMALNIISIVLDAMTMHQDMHVPGSDYMVRIVIESKRVAFSILVQRAGYITETSTHP